jgi:hypothetical protein
VDHYKPFAKKHRSKENLFSVLTAVNTRNKPFKWSKWCPKIAVYLENGSSHGKSDLILGIYRKFPFPNVSSVFGDDFRKIIFKEF